jgi:hypothetical protein
MPGKNRDIDMFRNAAQLESALNWYAIADSAQHSALPKALIHGARNVRCLLGASQGSPLAQHSPHLVELCSPQEASNSWSWISLNAKSKPCVSIIATRKSFEELFSQLSDCVEVVLPDGDVMYFAFWDPAILGTLMGQADDQTLHVKGPVLNSRQREKILNEMNGWWYWDRSGEVHSIVSFEAGCQIDDGPIFLSQVQVDDLVEASVPDHVLYHIKSNQHYLLNDVMPEKRYFLVSHALERARAIGLTGMRDLVNYVCVELIYKERIHDAAIKRVFDEVKNGRIKFDVALNQLP